ncbi:DUF1800 domain-containing protein [Lysobacter sp. TAB13]|uniref:DUF1800 domain-containing protein n=1 Tax=Lysobacter sp. TAB13 TaxID=3233065 RepID=UPI003F9E6236
MTRSLSASEQAALRQHLLQRYGALGRGTPSKAARAKLDGASGAAPLASPDMHAAPVMALPKDLPRPPFWIRVLGNLSYGATAQSIAEFNALGTTDAQRLANYVDWQLDWTNIDDSAVDTRLSNAGYTTLGKSLTQLWTDHVKPNPAYEIRMRPAWEAQRAALVRAVHSKRQLREVMVNFWHDHFNVMASDYDAGPVFVHYQRDVLRPQAFGNFRAMLEQVAKSTSMLYFLDNADNTRAGPNENFARELLELHTLGAEHYLGFMDPFQVPPDAEDPNYPAGYTDIDVYETASAFTGWSVKNGHWEYPTENDGSFVYRQAWHDAGPKFLLGRMLYPEQPALKDGRDVLDRLASHPGVARFICKKIIRRFVSDTPDPALVTSAAQIFRQNWQAPDQIAKVLRHVLNSSVFMQTWGAKARRPFEAVAAAMRTVGSDWTIAVGNQKSDEFNWLMGFTGHQPYDWPAPNGYPDVREAWSGSSSYAMTWRILNWVTETSESGVPLMPILATTRSKVPSWTATKLVDFWCQRILGYLPTAARRQTLIAFMAQNGDPATYVITDTNAWAGSDLRRHYNQERLRSMVSLILMSPEFLSR